MTTTTERLLTDLNRHRGKEYPDMGYSFFADVTGNGDNRRKVYTVITANGGVCYSYELNGATARERCDNIRSAIREYTSKGKDQ